VPLNMSWQVANSTVGLAQVLFLKGQSGQAQSLLNHIIEQAEAMNARDVLSEIYRVRAEIWLEKAAPEEAERAAQLAAAMAEESGDRTLLASAWRVMLAVQLAHDDLDTAQETLNRAHEALAGSPTGLESGRIAALASRLHARLGDQEQAASELEDARRIFAQLGAQIDLALLEDELA
jgi:ATP/maltotriose-dependent transcriptional regulator MalT